CARVLCGRQHTHADAREQHHHDRIIAGVLDSLPSVFDSWVGDRLRSGNRDELHHHGGIAASAKPGTNQRLAMEGSWENFGDVGCRRRAGDWSSATHSAARQSLRRREIAGRYWADVGGSDCGGTMGSAVATASRFAAAQPELGAHGRNQRQRAGPSHTLTLASLRSLSSAHGKTAIEVLNRRITFASRFFELLA